MLDLINDILTTFNNFVLGVPLIILILAIGIYLTFRLRLLQIICLPKALGYVLQEEEDGKGEISSFGALCTALSATIGNGNIAGVATAVVAGGPGALFWMVIAASLGMVTKYAEGVLAIKYRDIDKDGHTLGGPFYYIERGMGQKFQWIAKLFALFGIGVGLLGGGTFTQVTGIATAFRAFFDPHSTNTISIFGREYSIYVVIVSIVVTLFAALIIIGGFRRIATFAGYMVPFMLIIYMFFCSLVLVFNYEKIPGAFELIIKGAFNPSAVAGGAVGSLIVTMQKGIGRGIFSNEAGLGSTPIATASARTSEPVRQGLVAMTVNFFDTIIICSLTGLIVVITDAWRIPDLTGAAIANYAFNTGIPVPSLISSFVLMVCLAFFAFTTIIGWNYYSGKCLEYLCNRNKKCLKVFNFLYIFAILIGPYLTFNIIWNIADIFSGLMAIPNIIALFALSNVVVAETKSYFERHQR